MRTRLREPALTVIDDFLRPDRFRSLWRSVRAGDDPPQIAEQHLREFTTRLSRVGESAGGAALAPPSLWIAGPEADARWLCRHASAPLFLYLIHPQWNMDWGGEIVVSAAPERVPTRARATGVFSASRPTRSRRSPASGIARLVLARSNRLIVIAPRYPSWIAPIDPAAGDHRFGVLAGAMPVTRAPRRTR